MKDKKITLSMKVFASADELSEEDATLLKKARAFTKESYAPYSHFHVAAAALLGNGKIVFGSNQENASFPVSICAERILLANAAMRFPDVPIATMAITYHNMQGKSNEPISPCGMCRQALSEYQQRVGRPMRLLLSGFEGEVYLIENAGALLPLTFTGEDLRH
jgi:cytidine deaminase